MVQTSRSYRSERRGRARVARELRVALLGAFLGFILHWAIGWRPKPPDAWVPLPVEAIADRAALEGRRIAIELSPASSTGEAARRTEGAERGLRQLLEAWG